MELEKALPARIRAVAPSSNGAGVFIQCKDHVFLIQMEAQIANTLAQAMRREEGETTFTHDLLLNIIDGLDANLMRVVIDSHQQGIYSARIILRAHHPRDEDTRILEVTARSSDALVLATKSHAPVYVRPNVLRSTENVSLLLEELLMRDMLTEG